MAPALQVSVLKLNASLGQRGDSEGKGSGWIRGTLVVSEIAFACVLLVGAGLLIRSFMRVLEVQLGFRPESAAALRIDPNSQYATKEQKNSYITEALHRVRNIVGVEARGIDGFVTARQKPHVGRGEERSRLPEGPVSIGVRAHDYGRISACHGNGC